MTWFAWQGYNNGKAVDIAGSQEKQAVLIGFHGYSTESQAEANPNSVASLPNPLALAQKEFVNAIIADYGYAVRAGEQPGGPHATLTPGNVIAGTGQAAGSYAASAIPGVAQIGDFFGRLEEASTWVRVGEVVLGLLLIAVGIAEMTDAVPMATKIAKAVS